MGLGWSSLWNDITLIWNTTVSQSWSMPRKGHNLGAFHSEYLLVPTRTQLNGIPFRESPFENSLPSSSSSTVSCLDPAAGSFHSHPIPIDVVGQAGVDQLLGCKLFQLFLATFSSWSCIFISSSSPSQSIPNIIISTGWMSRAPPFNVCVVAADMEEDEGN